MVALFWGVWLVAIIVWMLRKKPFRRRQRPQQRWDFMDQKFMARNRR